MNRILFRADGNKIIGYGHIIRCVALAQFLRDRFSLSFASITPDQFVLNQLEGLCDVIFIENDFYVNHDLNHSRERFLSYELANIERTFDIIVLDGYFFSDEYLSRLKASGKKVVYIDDQYRFGVKCDLLINHLPDAPTKERDYINSQVKLLGTDYALIRKEFSEFKCLTHKSVSNTPKKLFIALGGTAELKLLNGLIQNIKSTGRSFHISVLSSVEVEGADMILNGLSSVEIAFQICNSDICLITPGIISYEVFSIRKPVIMGALSDYQTDTLRTFEEQGLCHSIGFWNQTDTASLEMAFSACIGRSTNQGLRFDGLSGGRILNAFLSL